MNSGPNFMTTADRPDGPVCDNCGSHWGREQVEDKDACPECGELFDEVPKLALTDDGLEAPEHLVGATGVITVEKPHLQMDITFVGDGVAEYDSNLTAFPTTGKTGYDIPESHIRIEGMLYEVVDERILNECPECGSDKIPAGSDEPKCYDCDTELEHPEEVNHQLTEVC